MRVSSGLPAWNMPSRTPCGRSVEKLPLAEPLRFCEPWPPELPKVPYEPEPPPPPLEVRRRGAIGMDCEGETDVTLGGAEPPHTEPGCSAGAGGEVVDGSGMRPVAGLSSADSPSCEDMPQPRGPGILSCCGSGLFQSSEGSLEQRRRALTRAPFILWCSACRELGGQQQRRVAARGGAFLRDQRAQYWAKDMKHQTRCSIGVLTYSSSHLGVSSARRRYCKHDGDPSSPFFLISGAHDVKGSDRQTWHGDDAPTPDF